MLPGVTGAMGGHSAWLQVWNWEVYYSNLCSPKYLDTRWRIIMNTGAEISFDCRTIRGKGEGAEVEVWCQPVQPRGNHGRIPLQYLHQRFRLKSSSTMQINIGPSQTQAIQFKIDITFHIVVFVNKTPWKCFYFFFSQKSNFTLDLITPSLGKTYVLWLP